MTGTVVPTRLPPGHWPLGSCLSDSKDKSVDNQRMSLGSKFTVLRADKKKSRAPTAGTRPGRWGGINQENWGFL